MSNIQFIKDNFAANYRHEPDVAPPNTLIHDTFNGCRIHTRSGIKTLIRMLKPKNILEIGSWHCATTTQMALAQDEIFGDDTSATVHTFDIKPGGYDGNGKPPLHPRIHTHLWMPHKTSYDEWKLTDPNIFKKELFLKSSNSEIFQENFRYLLSIKPREGFDLVYIDGDHSFEGTKFDHIYTLQVINPTATIIIDDIWDDRLKEVRRYFDQLPNEKWDFKEWNLEHPDMVQNMGVISPENIFKDN